MRVVIVVLWVVTASIGDLSAGPAPSPVQMTPPQTAASSGEALPSRTYGPEPVSQKPASYSGPTEALRFFVRIFQVVFSPQDGPTCPYRPVCSAYARQAYRRHGPAVGTVMTAERLIRCNHDARGGDDPVPDTP